MSQDNIESDQDAQRSIAEQDGVEQDGVHDGDDSTITKLLNEVRAVRALVTAQIESNRNAPPGYKTFPDDEIVYTQYEPIYQSCKAIAVERGLPLPPVFDLPVLSAFDRLEQWNLRVARPGHDEGGDHGHDEGDGRAHDNDGLRVELEELKVYWGDTPLAINAHADFKVLQRLHDSFGEVVSYQELLRTLKPDGAVIVHTVAKVEDAPEEVKHAVCHIRSAFQKAGAEVRIKAIRRTGYRLEPHE